MTLVTHLNLRISGYNIAPQQKGQGKFVKFVKPPSRPSWIWPEVDFHNSAAHAWPVYKHQYVSLTCVVELLMIQSSFTARFSKWQFYSFHFSLGSDLSLIYAGDRTVTCGPYASF